MPKLKITGVPPYDGEYELDFEGFSSRELHMIKQISGVRGGELNEAIQAGDNDLNIAFTTIVLQRAGHNPVNVDALWDAPVGAIDVIGDDDEPEDERRPPDSSPTPSGPPSSPAVEDDKSE